ncbi:MAG TPA: hypothetical protein VLD37_06445 [Candidatus Bilamarchaeum sp.]|nr:hypothetical protein [Candidatus Bilamarchaeum sp.]
MTKYAFSQISIDWLKENHFTEEDIDILQDILNMMEYYHRKGEARLRLPKDSSDKVAAVATLLDSITDEKGWPICFEGSGLIDIPQEARDYFEDDLELEEIEKVTEKLRKIKFARRYSYPRRRGGEKPGREEP